MKTQNIYLAVIFSFAVTALSSGCATTAGFGYDEEELDAALQKTECMPRNSIFDQYNTVSVGGSFLSSVKACAVLMSPTLPSGYTTGACLLAGAFAGYKASQILDERGCLPEVLQSTYDASSIRMITPSSTRD